LQSNKNLDKQKLTQAKAAKLLGVAQPRISDIRRGKIQLFTIDALVNMLVKLGVPVSLVIDDLYAA
jgi:predicted XRE-type DNA-binding protein